MKLKTFYYVAASLLATTFFSCEKNEDDSVLNYESSTILAKSTTTFSDNFERPTNQLFDRWDNHGGCYDYSFKIQNDPANNNNKVLRVRSIMDEDNSNCNDWTSNVTSSCGGLRRRVELLPTTRAGYKEDFWIGFRLFIPNNFPNKQPSARMNLSQIIPVFNGQDGTDMKFHIDKHQELELEVRTSNTGRTNFPLGNLDRGTWNNWVIHFKRSKGNDGVAKVWKNNQLLVNHSGQTTYTTNENGMWKIGIYNGCLTDLDNDKTYDVFFDNVKLASGTNLFDLVNPAQMDNSDNSNNGDSTDPTNENSICATNNWQSFPIDSQNNTFSSEWDITPKSQNINTTITLADGNPIAWSENACIVRFKNGNISAFNETGYTNLRNFNANQTYKVKLEVDVSSKTYSIFINDQLEASNYKFRNDLPNETKINHWAIYEKNSISDLCVENFKLSSNNMNPICATTNWQSFPIVSQNNTFSSEWDITPENQNINTTVTLADGNPTTWSENACIVRFKNGKISAFNETGYTDLRNFNANQTYKVKLEVNVSSKTYSIFINNQLEASNYKFRNDLPNETKIDHWAIYEKNSSNSLCVENVNIN
ncbi:heparin lyase I family protein [Aureivirga marina]|uniref:heparin lyase I family protein n=1 Tax=Aureivirga marina TaxID=1182451 RepID=UPI0018CAB2BF|nr:heparin lyase I family protein [Aureivirga marina]